jgi:DnaJ-domain-containing protein 1
MTALIREGSSLVVSTPYNPALVNDLKSRIPSTDRKFEKEHRGRRNVWIVSTQYERVIQDLIRRHLNEHVEVEAGQPNVFAKTGPEMRVLDVRYVGATKDRGGDRSAFGYSAGQWSVVFPEDVLRGWFDAPKSPAEESSLFSVLNVKREATTEEIKTAYRRMVRQWHPDVCKEPDAHNVFLRIQEAYETLSDPVKRAKYGAGLALAATLTQPPNTQYQVNNGYRSPLRCGYIMAKGEERLGRFVVSEILAWEDIVDSAGRTLVVSYPLGAERPVEQWC